MPIDLFNYDPMPDSDLVNDRNSEATRRLLLGLVTLAGGIAVTTSVLAFPACVGDSEPTQVPPAVPVSVEPNVVG